MEEKPESVRLDYSIHSCSSYSGNYAPENIMENNPSNQLSRWFTDSTTSSQYIILKLKTTAIVETITFGKYLKAHVSDLKKFQIFGGIEENNLSLLLTAGLKKDSSHETFRLRHKTKEGFDMPLNYIKIVPMQSWGPAYNYTIWYVELRGSNREDLISSAMETINLRIEEEAVRIILKHLRRRRYTEAFDALSRESGVKLEGDLQERLWNALVENEDYQLAEQIIDEAAEAGEFDWYLSWQPLKPVWRQISPCSPQVEDRLCCGDLMLMPTHPTQELPCADRDPGLEGNEVVMNGGGVEPPGEQDVAGPGAGRAKPGPRGGHQLVVDATTGTLYLFGGWNGTEDLDDLWSFCTRSERWSLVCARSGAAGGPSPRSCHKMVFDPVRRRLYTLGRYLDSAQRVPANMKSEMYMYDVGGGAWSVASADTARAGGPRLVFDHQMCLDADTGTIYVFGGRVLPLTQTSKMACEEPASPQYSGLYAYYIAKDTWQQLLPDQHDLPAPQPRVSHSMLFHPVQRRLYIFGGQRNKEQLGEVWWWDAEAGRGAALGTWPAPPPAAGLTQRATLDPDSDHMYVLSGMSKEKDKKVFNTLWMFSLKRLTWTCLYRNEAVAPAEPRPRFAHQLVYDPVQKIHYLFGGNPGNSGCPRLRLDDLWSLRLEGGSAGAGGVAGRARAALREAAYRALVGAGRDAHALHYLRTHLRDALDHTDPQQVSRFGKLASVLFAGAGGAAPRAGALTPRRARALARRRACAAPPAHLGHALAAVLGAEEEVPEQQPWEEVAAPAPETWELGEEGEERGPGAEWDSRMARADLYDELCRYFRPSVVPPDAHLHDLIHL